MNKLLLTPEELDNLFVKYEKKDPEQLTSFERIISKAQVKKCKDNWEELVPKDHICLLKKDYCLATGVKIE